MRPHLGLVLLLTALAPACGTPPAGDVVRLHATKDGSRFSVELDGRTVVAGRVTLEDGPATSPPIRLRIALETRRDGEAATHTVRIVTTEPTARRVVVDTQVSTSSQAFAAETASGAQQRVRMVRTAVGPSWSRRNNAVYDRGGDWAVAGPPDLTHITPLAPDRFRLRASGQGVELTFRPAFYRQHKGIRFFDPGAYQPWPHSVAGWCSWWAYQADISEPVVIRVADAFSSRLRDFGYEYLQVDDGYFLDRRGIPESFLANDRFPSGLQGLATAIATRGLKPGIWLHSCFEDEATLQQHPDWFVQDAQGRPFKGDFINFGLDGSNPAMLDAVVRPSYRRLPAMGYRYVKVDSLRHLLYDAYYPTRADLARRGQTPESAYRAFLGAVRQELGPETYMLSCWGVLPESAGLADACRLGRDGFAASTLTQYNSWNNVVWRNDPDHVDLAPEGEEIIRPVVVSMAGAQLMLSDRAEVYERNEKLEGARRAAPVLVSMPGQLYDVDPSRSDAVRDQRRNTEGGGPDGPTDAWPEGPGCEWWLQEIDRTFEHWVVLARLSWQPLEAVDVTFADLGLAGDAPYVVHEFFSRRTLGVFRGSFPTDAQAAKEVRVFSIRPALDRPQVVSTSRHISQGGVDLEAVQWNGTTRALSGTSALVAGDPYTLVVRPTNGFRLQQAEAELPAQVRPDGDRVLVTWISPGTRKLAWRLVFSPATPREEVQPSAR